MRDLFSKRSSKPVVFLLFQTSFVLNNVECLLRKLILSLAKGSQLKSFNQIWFSIYLQSFRHRHEGDHRVDGLLSRLGQRGPGQHRTSQDQTSHEKNLLRGIEGTTDLPS